MKQIIIIVAVLAFSVSAIAQETTKPAKKSRKEEKRARINAQIRAEEEGVIAYKKHFAVGIKLTSDGYGVSFEKGYAKSVKSATLFHLKLQNVSIRKKKSKVIPVQPPPHHL